MQFKERPPVPDDPPPEPLEREDVQVTANRCPFCRDDVRAEDAQAVVCAQCLTRHHDPCWVEGGACSSCGHGVRMRREEQQASAGGGAATATSSRTRLRLLAVVALTLLALGAVFLKARYDATVARERYMQEALEAEARAKADAERLEAEIARERAERLRRMAEERRLAEAQLERERARVEAERARVEAERARAEAQRARAEAERAEAAAAERAAQAETNERIFERTLAEERAKSQARLKKDEARRRIREAAGAAEQTKAEKEHSQLKARMSLQQGMRLEAAGDLAMAAAEYGKVTRFDPGNAEGWIRRASVREALGKVDLAIYDYERALICDLTEEQQTLVEERLKALDPASEDDE